MLGKAIDKYKNMPRIVKASMWFLICSFLQKGISFITTPIFTRLMTTAEYGNYNVYVSWLGIVTIIVTLNLSSGVYTQSLVKFDQERNVISSSLQGLTLTMVSAWTIIYLFFQDFWNQILSLSTIQVLSMLVTIWATAAFGFWATEQRVKLNYKSLVCITVISSILQPVISILAVKQSADKVTARILTVAIIQVMIYVWLFAYQICKGKRFYSRKFWLYALSFNIPLIPHYLSQTLLNSADRIMIDRMSGASEAGIYSLAYSIANIMILFNTALLQTMNPWIYQKIKNREEKDIAGIAYSTLILIAIVNLMLIAFSPEIVHLFAPPKYSDAIWVIPPIAMSVYFIFAYSLFADFEFYYKKTKFIMAASVLSALTNIVLNYVFIKIFGYMAAGYTTLFCYIVYAVAHYFCMLHVCKEKMDGAKIYEPKYLLGITGSFIGVGFILLLTYYNSFIRYAAVLLIFAALIINFKRIKKLIMNTISQFRSQAS